MANGGGTMVHETSIFLVEKQKQSIRRLGGGGWSDSFVPLIDHFATSIVRPWIGCLRHTDVFLRNNL